MRRDGETRGTGERAQIKTRGWVGEMSCGCAAAVSFPQDERLAQVQHEEQEMLETQSIPLRNYLMRHVMPTLTKGLMEVCNVRPDDPVDYLVSASN